MKRRKTWGILIAVLCLACSLLLGGCTEEELQELEAIESELDEGVTGSEVVREEAGELQELSGNNEQSAEKEDYVTYSFRTKKQQQQHFEKHGSEFGNITEEEYLRMANDLINSNSDSVLTKRESEDNDYVYYDEDKNEFLILSTDGYIRTFFKPSAGIKYYNRQ